MPGQGVHGEVAPGEVVLHAARATDLLGVAAVGVETVHAIGGDLNALTRAHGGDAPELDAGLHHRDAGLCKRRFVLPPGARAAHVHVVARSRAERVAHPAAHEPRLVPGHLEGIEHGEAVGRGQRGVDVVAHAGLVAHCHLQTRI